MWVVILTSSYLLSQNCLGLNLIDLPVSSEFDLTERVQRRNLVATTANKSAPKFHLRQDDDDMTFVQQQHDDQSDNNLKSKIKTLVEQTMHDTEAKIKSIQDVKEESRNSSSYRVGFVLSLVKKARDVLNELFNVAVKHRDSWRALEQLKVFELIVHTNVDVTNLVRHLVEIHLQQTNGTSSGTAFGRRAVVVL